MSSASDLEEGLAPFLSAQQIITNPLSTFSAMLFVYGIYCVIFGLSIRALFRTGSSAHSLYKGGSIALFVLATTYTAIVTWGFSRQTFIHFDAATTKNYAPLLLYLTHDDGKSAWNGIQGIISTLMNTIADAMLIHRCYITFNSNKFILYPLVFVASVLNGIDLGCVLVDTITKVNPSKDNNNIIGENAFTVDTGAVICMAVFQIVLTFMTGARIWWITREARKLTVGVSTHSKFNNIIAIIIESALLYAGTLLTQVVVNLTWDPKETGVAPFNAGDILVLVSGLAPTMVIARVAYGKSVESVQQTLSTFCIADIEDSQENSVAAGQEAIDFGLQTESGMEEVQRTSETSLAAEMD